MFRLSAVFLLVALVAGVVGFGGIENFSWDGAKVVALIFFVLSGIYFVAGIWNKPAPLKGRRR